MNGEGFAYFQWMVGYGFVQPSAQHTSRCLHWWRMKGYPR